MSNQADHSERIDRLHQAGLVDMHFDLPMDLYEKRARQGVVEADFLADFLAGGVGVLGAAIYLEDHYLPEMGLRVALGQVARLYAEAEACERLSICRNHADILQARQAGRIAVLITMSPLRSQDTYSSFEGTYP